MKLHLMSPQLISELGFQHAIIIIAVAVIFYLFTNALYQIYFSPLSKIPGPWYAAVSRLWVRSRALKGRLIFDAHALHERYGRYVRISPVISSGEDLGIAFITDHDLYKRRRKAYGNAFSNSNVRLLEPVVRKHIDSCMKKVKREVEGARTPDLKMWAQLLAADIIGEISYGVDFKMLENEKLDTFLQDTTSFFVTMAMRGQFPHEVQGCKGGEPRPTLFSKIFGLMDNPSVKHSLTMEEVKAEAFINNLTGSHTTPSTATFIIWEIFRNEDIRTKLEQELIEFNVSKEGIMDETLQKLPYLSLILKEGLRLYAAAQH
ncbi:hypothetical protein H072_10923 [Dactylellina haptotyla CBS 200.50]|uniref:Cytochrome P450 n=1 Tax=Dactylellina haptotyla (strain CBS 200.50) TaxID=1284197 RepID=S7ZYX9_DACHA|nr:hypothetical protein H072_10923 [Dactylellina haptotyla CBS 200.50]